MYTTKLDNTTTQLLHPLTIFEHMSQIDMVVEQHTFNKKYIQNTYRSYLIKDIVRLVFIYYITNFKFKSRS